MRPGLYDCKHIKFFYTFRVGKGCTFKLKKFPRWLWYKLPVQGLEHCSRQFFRLQVLEGRILPLQQEVGSMQLRCCGRLQSGHTSNGRLIHCKGLELAHSFSLPVVDKCSTTWAWCACCPLSVILNHVLVSSLSGTYLPFTLAFQSGHTLSGKTMGLVKFLLSRIC